MLAGCCDAWIPTEHMDTHAWDTDPPQDPLNPWSMGSKKKRIQKIVGFSKKKTEEEVLKE